MTSMEKLRFAGKIVSVQPRLRLTRSFDQFSHTYLGYAVRIAGEIDSRSSTFSIGIGEATHGTHQLKVNDVISGECLPVADPNLDPVEYHEVSKLQVISADKGGSPSEPWELVPPALEVYRERGYRRLAARTYDAKCSSCLWGARMAVEIIIDPWDSWGQVDYRHETFCYGPLSCKYYKAGPRRQVEGRKGMVYVEEDWVDEEMTSHRDADE